MRVNRLKAQRRIRSLLAIVLTTITVLMVYFNQSISLIDRLELDLYDLRLKQTLLNEIDPRIVIIDIDEESLATVGRWPWSRDVLAQLLDQLYGHYGVAVTAFDMVFAEPDNSIPTALLEQIKTATQSPSGLSPSTLSTLSESLSKNPADQVFAQTIERYQPVMGFVFDGKVITKADHGLLAPPIKLQPNNAKQLSWVQAEGHIANLYTLQAGTPWGGFFDNPSVDADGVYRRVPLIQRYQGELYPSLSLAALMALYQLPEAEVVTEPTTNRSLPAIVGIDVAGTLIPVDEKGAALVPYRGYQGSFPYISAADVLNGSANMDQLAGTIALVGTSAAGLLDLRVTPMSSRYAGVEVHANLLSGMLDGRYLQQPDYTKGVEILQLLLCGLLLALLLPRLKPVTGFVVTVLISGVIVGFNIYAWQSLNWVIPLANTLALVVLLFIFLIISGYFFETRNIAGLSKQFGQYIPPALVHELSQQQSVNMEGEQREMTVFFSDIRDFTPMTENLSPTELNRLMNRYLSAMTAIIHEHKGTVDKYIGDAIMAFWGAPLSDDQHAKHALQAALAMQAQLPRLNQELNAEGLPELQVGMGLHSGVMHVGNMGSDFRTAYTVMGDAVNLTSRVESLSKTYGVGVLVTEAIANETPDAIYRRLEQVRVKGRESAVWLLEPLSTDLTCEHIQSKAKAFNAAVEAYQNKEWETAKGRLEDFLQQWPGDRPSLLLLQRMAEHGGQPPTNWSPVYRFDHK